MAEQWGGRGLAESPAGLGWRGAQLWSQAFPLPKLLTGVGTG